MEWLDLVTRLGLTGTSVLLTYAVITLWQSNQKKDAEIARLNDQRVKDLIAVVGRDD